MVFVFYDGTDWESDLDFDFDSAGQFQTHEGIHRLGRRAVDVDQTLVRARSIVHGSSCSRVVNEGPCKCAGAWAAAQGH